MSQEILKDVFITYSWGVDSDNNKVIDLTDFLRRNGFSAEMDRLVTQANSATNFNKMTHDIFTKYKKIVVVLSENYKKKAENFTGGVGDEYLLIMQEIKKSETKFILVHFDGKREDVTPLALQSRDILNISNIKEDPSIQNKFFSKLCDVKELIFSDVGNTRPIIKKKYADSEKEHNFLNLRKEVDHIFNSFEHLTESEYEVLNSLSMIYIERGEIEEQLKLEYRILGYLINSKDAKENVNTILQKVQYLIPIAEEIKVDVNLTIDLIIIALNFFQFLETRKFDYEISLAEKLIFYQKGQNLICGNNYYKLASIYYLAKKYDKAEETIFLCLEEYTKAKELLLEKDKFSLYTFPVNLLLSQIQHDSLKLKESLSTLLILENNVDNYISKIMNEIEPISGNINSHSKSKIIQRIRNLKNDIYVNKNNCLWKIDIVDRLVELNSTCNSLNLNNFNGIKEYFKYTNNLLIQHLEFNSSLDLGSDLEFIFDYWGRSNYTSMLSAFRHFRLRDTRTIKLRVSTINEIRHYLKVLPLYYDHVVLLWNGDLISDETGEGRIFVPPDFYPQHANNNFIHLPMKFHGHNIAIASGTYNKLPLDLIHFILNEAKPLFENGYFSVIPELLGGYIDHPKQNLFDFAMDRFLTNPLIINHGNINNSNFFQLPYIQNINFNELYLILQEWESDIFNLRNSLNLYQNSLFSGSQVADTIKEQISHFKNILKKAQHNYNLTFLNYGCDFIDLERSFDIFVKDHLKRVNENLAFSLEKMIQANPYSIFIKTELINKTWNINSQYLLADIKASKPSFINHWIVDTNEHFTAQVIQF